jgi:hypothetical protein
MTHQLKRQPLQIFLLFMSASLTMAAQTFRLTPVLLPGATIAGRTLAVDATIGSAALNDAGEIAFAVYCGDGTVGIFTSRRIVVRQGDEVDGKFISVLSIGSPIAINNRGQVAFEAWYADSKESDQADGWWNRGIFIDNHFVSTVPSDKTPLSLTLTDDGRVLVNEQQRASATSVPTARPPAQQKKGGLLDRLQIKLPKNLPVGIDPSKPQQAPSAAAHGEKPEAGPVPALPQLRANARGQVVIPVNLGPGGFVLLLATPSPAISPTRVNP